MSKVTLEAYLFFDGNCTEAMEFYKSIFGGKLNLTRYDDVPGTKPENHGKIIHADLSGGDVHLMASDSGLGPVAKIAKVQVSLAGSDEKKLRKIFDGLAKGGKVKYPLVKAFWGDLHGGVKDKYGIDWMVTVGQ